MKEKIERKPIVKLNRALKTLGAVENLLISRYDSLLKGINQCVETTSTGEEHLMLHTEDAGFDIKVKDKLIGIKSIPVCCTLYKLNAKLLELGVTNKCLCSTKLFASLLNKRTITFESGQVKVWVQEVKINDVDILIRNEFGVLKISLLRNKNLN